MPLLVLALLCLFPPARAQDPQMAAGFEHFYNLEYDEAIAQFQRGTTEKPGSPDRHNYLALAMLFQEMYRSGALESEMVTGNNAFLRRPKMNPSEEVQRQFTATAGKAMSLSQARLARNPKDIGALYALGVSYALRANFNWLVRKSWLDSLRDATTARKQHNRVTELDPSFIDARLIQGTHDYVVGSLPFAYKLLGFLVGFHGDKETGIRTLQLVAQKGHFNRVDAEVLLAAIYRRERRAQDALPLLADLIRRYPRNFLLRFEMAQMCSEIGDKAGALGAIRKIEELKNAGAAGYQRVSLEKILSARGIVQFWYGDLDDALANLRRVTAQADELDLNTGVYSWLRMAQTLDLKNRRAEALAAYRKTIDYAPQSDAAKEARRCIGTPYRRKGN
jgi:tetratricopeptide (TPR) repeat protein